MIRASGLLVLSSLTFVVGCWVAWTGWRQPRPTLAHALAHLRRTPGSATVTDGAALARVGAAISRHDSRLAIWTNAWRRPLRLVGRRVDEHVGLLAMAATVGFVAPSIVLAVLQATGVASLAVWVPAVLSVAGAVVVPVVVHSDTLARSAEVAIDVRHQLGAYLDMVTMLLAGNSGYEGALDQAARAGDGLLFQALRRRMREVSATGRSLVDALELVADDYGIVELEQVAATARLSAAEGAPVARTLTAKCATLRSTLAAEQEAAARVRIDKVTPPLVGMALLFMALIIYPALDLT